MWHGDWSGADWALMSVMMILFWGAVVAGIVWLVRGSGDRNRRTNPRTTVPKADANGGSHARNILDERYARGELSDEEYRARRDVLSGR